MMLKWPAGHPVPVTVVLELHNGVELRSPDLLRAEGAAMKSVGAPNPVGPSHAVWAGVTRFQNDADLTLEVEWVAQEPQKTSWNYTATVRVEDAAGVLLPPRPGQTNPSSIDRQIVNHMDVGQTAIAIW